MLHVVYDDAKVAKVMQGRFTLRRWASEKEAVLWDAQLATHRFYYHWRQLCLDKD